MLLLIPAYLPSNKTTQHLSTTGPPSPFTSQPLKIGIFEQFSDVHLGEIEHMGTSATQDGFLQMASLARALPSTAICCQDSFCIEGSPRSRTLRSLPMTRETAGFGMWSKEFGGKMAAFEQLVVFVSLTYSFL